MSVNIDTNVLLRIALNDFPGEAAAAEAALNAADIAHVSVTALCEFSWVLQRTYKLDRSQIAMTIRSLLERKNIRTRLYEVESGLAMLDQGGDFADGVIAADQEGGRRRTFISFDRKAVRLLEAQGHRAVLLKAMP